MKWRRFTQCKDMGSRFDDPSTALSHFFQHRAEQSTADQGRPGQSSTAGDDLPPSSLTVLSLHTTLPRPTPPHTPKISLHLSHCPNKNWRDSSTTSTFLGAYVELPNLGSSIQERKFGYFKRTAHITDTTLMLTDVFHFDSRLRGFF